MKKVLVTGGSGFLGKRLKIVKPDWIYISSKDHNLIDKDEVKKMFLEYKDISAVVHLAGKVGGIKANAQHPVDFFYNNILINTYVLNEAHLNGVSRVLSSLSTCAFPDVLDSYPFSEIDIHAGAPAKTNISYGFSKRALFIQSNAYRVQYKHRYSCFCPSNIYGPGEDFNLESSHFVASMIRKFSEARDGDEITFWGTGKPLRQQLFVDDLAKIVPILLEKHNDDLPIIVAPDENVSIKETIEMCRRISGKDVKIKFNGKLDGQYRKDGANDILKKMIPEFEFTSLESGLKITYDWYEKNRKSA